MGTGGPFPGAKVLPGRDADHSPRLVSRLRISRRYISPLPPSAFMACSGAALATSEEIFVKLTVVSRVALSQCDELWYCIIPDITEYNVCRFSLSKKLYKVHSHEQRGVTFTSRLFLLSSRSSPITVTSLIIFLRTNHVLSLLVYICLLFWD
jgi:hypothetical protein